MGKGKDVNKDFGLLQSDGSIRKNGQGVTTDSETGDEMACARNKKQKIKWILLWDMETGNRANRSCSANRRINKQFMKTGFCGFH